MQKILLLGANGQLGREWQHQLKNEQQFKLIACSSTQVDITDFDKTAEAIISNKPDVVINCAAYTKVDLAETERDKALLTNAAAVGNIAKLCKKHSARLIHYSTDYVFSGKKEDQDKFPRGYSEDHPADPINWYGQTKWLGEQAVRSSGCGHLIIRLSWLCGAFGNNFVTTMLSLAETKHTLQIVDDQRGSPSFTADAVEKTLQLFELNHDGTYHITSRGIITWADFARAIFECSGLSIDVQPIPSSQFKQDADRPRFSKLDTSKIERAGISAIDWQIGLKQMLNSRK